MKTFKGKAEYFITPTYSIRITYLTEYSRLTKIIFTHDDLSYTEEVLWNFLLNKDFSEVEITEKEYNNLVKINIIQNMPLYSLCLEEN